MNESSDVEHHIVNNDSESLTADTEAYTFLEHIKLPWPSQTVAFSGNEKILIGENPSEEKKDEAVLNCLDFSNTEDYTDLSKFTSSSIYNAFINRIRCQKNEGEIFIANTDDYFYVFKDFSWFHEIPLEKADYGLDLNDYIACFANEGKISSFDFYKLEIIDRIHAHEKSINDIKLKENQIYAGSDDFTISIFDRRDREIQRYIKFASDVNSFDVQDNFLIAGLENGHIEVLDLRNLHNKSKIIDWHKSPITSLKFYERDQFWSSSHEKVCLWDLDIEEEKDWEFPNELIFEHSGDKNYKDVDSIKSKGERIFSVCGESGLCFFTPIGFDEND